jgi:hypothetical protein
MLANQWDKSHASEIISCQLSALPSIAIKMLTGENRSVGNHNSATLGNLLGEGLW